MSFRRRSFRPYALTASFLLVLCSAATLWFEPGVSLHHPREELLCQYLFGCADLAAKQAFQSFRAGERLEASLGYFKAAVRRDEASPFRWCDLADAYVASGDLDKARYCFSRARLLGPNSPVVRLRFASFSLHAGDPQRAIGIMSGLLKDEPRYDDIVFSYYQRIGLSVPEILERGMPVDSRPANQFFHRVLAAGAPAQALTVWRWICSHSLANEREALAYVDSLVKKRQYTAAAQAWQVYLPTRPASSSNLMLNGGFEQPPAGLTFDWAIEASDQAQAIRDCSVAQSGKCSLRIRFDAHDNLTYHNTSETILIRPGTYLFQAYVRAEDITTDQGVRFRLFDPENPSRMDVVTAAVTGKTDWIPVRQKFTVAAGTQVIVVQVYRAPSERFENRIKGTIWLDDVSIAPATV